MADRELDAMIAALRDRGAHGEPVPRQVDTTRRRVMASLEQRATGRRRRVVVIVAALTLGTGTLSWAATTGRLAPVLARIGLRADVAPSVGPGSGAIDKVLRPHGARVARVASVASVADDRAVAPEPEPVPVLEAQPTVPELPLPAPPPVSHRRARPAVTTLDESAARFRRADELHVRGADADALAAWDDYLAAYPTSPLAVEARYNRALVLVRLRRWDEARLALAPFVAGRVTPPGYRQAEATALVGAIERHLHAAAQKRGEP
ncbi:MAG TPA: hypothetical protein VHE35_13430 [Kofleriaceae bacterium]|nr:hypothetical protein [Kofleriaceae bacterium]